MRSYPSDILTRIHPTVRVVLSSLESVLRIFQDNLAVRGELADVAPEELPSLTKQTLEIVVDFSEFYMGSKTWLAAELSVHDATRVTRALHRLLKTCVRWFKWMEDLKAPRGRTPGQERRSSIYGTIRDAKGWQTRSIKRASRYSNSSIDVLRRRELNTCGLRSLKSWICTKDSSRIIDNPCNLARAHGNAMYLIDCSARDM